jgi:16S rRNA (guanine527-N7)-methyltransferase
VKPPALSNEFIERTLRPFGTSIDAALAEAIRTYVDLLLQWNSKIALTTITEPTEILRLHFGESFFAAAVAKVASGRVADIGTGAGFPGIPIRMVAPAVHLTLVESVAKKTAFLGEAVRRLRLSGVDIIRCRMEDFTPERKFDFVTARALGHYEKLLEWSGMQLSQTGKLVLLLGQDESKKLSGISTWKWNPPVQIPGTASKFLLIGEHSS